jgi:serine/threonine-protein kinase
MADVAAERELLFGLLALQNDLIDRDALVGAFQAWSRDRTRSLAEHLVDRGTLDAGDRNAVEVLVAHYLNKHGGDPEKSLAAISAGRTNFQRFEAADAVGLEDMLGQIDAFSQPTKAAAGDGDGTASYSFGVTTAKGTRFLLLRPHAKGGIGQVGVALDTELNREVALKEIQPRLADDPACRSRFLLEAEVTGRLEHPGVVPVYGLGADAQGHPYYAMRLIRGDSLKQAIDRFHADDALSGRDRTERAIALRQLLNRFIDVCNAVAYAHSRGVIHRDLKPSNVMLGPYGETLVVDWGLAKVVGRDDQEASPEATLRPASGFGSGSSETQAGSVVGTPAYMSPEQAEGRLEAVGPASDVHSLGATLYCLLTGKPPIQADDAAEALLRAQRGDYRPPREVNPRVPRGLDAICQKAMAARPADRYGTARALAGDVEHWLADEPVAAFGEPVAVRLVRWARHHRTAVAAALVLLMAATTALAAGTVLLGRANRRIEEQRDLARGNFEQARAAVNTYLTQVSEESALRQPGLEQLRERLLRSALGYYEAFIRQRSDDPSLRLELADAYRRAGEIIGAIGSRAEAREHLGRAVAAFDRALANAPRNPEPRAGLARSLAALAHYEVFDDRPADGVKTALRAVPLFEALRAERPDSAEFARMLGRCHDLAGVGCCVAGRFNEMLPHSRRAVAELEEAVRRFPADSETLRLLALATNNLGSLQSHVGFFEEGLDAYARAVERVRQVVAAAPLDTRARVDLARSLTNIGVNRQFVGRPTSSLEPVEEAHGLIASVVRESPDVTLHAEQLAFVLECLGTNEAMSGRTARARETLQRCIAVKDELDRKGARNFNALQSVAWAYTMLGRLEADAGRREAAAAAFDRAVEICRQVPGENLGNEHLRAQALEARQGAVLARPAPADADGKARRIEDQRAIVREREDLVRTGRNAAERRFELSFGLAALSGLLLDAGAVGEAAASLEHALAVIDEAIRSKPGRLNYRRLRAEILGHQARLALDRGDRGTAGRMARDALQITEALAREDAAYLYDLARAHALAARLDSLDPDRKSAGEAHAKSAIDALRRALATGFDDRDRLRVAPALQPIRDRDDFRALLK